MLLIWILGFSLLGSVGAAGGAALLLTFPAGMFRRVIPALLSYAVGTLLAAAFLGLIPHALERVPVDTALGTVLAGLVLFFLLEKLVIWRHCHDLKCTIHGTAGPLILMGDALHNFIDGIVIAAAFLSAIPLGVAAAIAVIVHEVPQRDWSSASRSIRSPSDLPGRISAELVIPTSSSSEVTAALASRRSAPTTGYPSPPLAPRYPRR